MNCVGTFGYQCSWLEDQPSAVAERAHKAADFNSFSGISENLPQYRCRPTVRRYNAKPAVNSSRSFWNWKQEEKLCIFLVTKWSPKIVVDHKRKGELLPQKLKAKLSLSKFCMQYHEKFVGLFSTTVQPCIAFLCRPISPVRSSPSQAHFMLMSSNEVGTAFVPAEVLN